MVLGILRNQNFIYWFIFVYRVLIKFEDIAVLLITSEQMSIQS